MISKIALMLGVAAFSLLPTVTRAQTESSPRLAPDALVRQTADEILSFAAADKGVHTGDIEGLIKVVEVKVAPHFDFDTMTRLAVGKHWRDASDLQRQSLTVQFRKLLLRTYTRAYSLNRGVKSKVKPLKTRGDEAEVTVKSELILPSSVDTVSVDYDMRATASGWKIYNVTVEGVSLVTNYRSEFAEQIHKSGIDGLIHLLEQRNARG